MTGEFTKLAYEAGKMDLCQVEGLHDLVNAESFEQMRLAGRWASVGAFISQGREA